MTKPDLDASTLELCDGLNMDLLRIGALSSVLTDRLQECDDEGMQTALLVYEIAEVALARATELGRRALRKIDTPKRAQTKPVS